MTDAETRPAAWYPDPFGRHEHRYFDGERWTEHVASHGRQSTDPPLGDAKVPTVNRPTEKVQRDVAKAGLRGPNAEAGLRGPNAEAGLRGPNAEAGATGAAATDGGDGTLFTEPVLVVNQKAKLIELNNEYAIYDQNGTQIGAVRQVGQSKMKKLVRLVADVDQFLTHKLQIVDAAGKPVLALTRPAKVLKSRVVVEDGDGRPVGEIVQENMVGKIRFGLQAGERRVGSINAENWRAWNFNVQDESGSEVARITKTWEGMAKTMFTTADNYVVQIHRPLEEPLRSLVVAAALGVDTALKQDQRGLN